MRLTGFGKKHGSLSVFARFSANFGRRADAISGAAFRHDRRKRPTVKSYVCYALAIRTPFADTLSTVGLCFRRVSGGDAAHETSAPAAQQAVLGPPWSVVPAAQVLEARLAHGVAGRADDLAGGIELGPRDRVVDALRARHLNSKEFAHFRRLLPTSTA